MHTQGARVKVSEPEGKKSKHNDGILFNYTGFGGSPYVVSIMCIMEVSEQKEHASNRKAIHSRATVSQSASI